MHKARCSEHSDTNVVCVLIVPRKCPRNPQLVLSVKERKWVDSEHFDLIDSAFAIQALNLTPSYHQFQLQSSTEATTSNVTGI